MGAAARKGGLADQAEFRGKGQQGGLLRIFDDHRTGDLSGDGGRLGTIPPADDHRLAVLQGEEP